MLAAKIVSGMMTKERHSIFRSAVALFFGAMALGSVVFTQESRAQSARSDATARSGDRSKLVGQLDHLVRGAIERDGIPGLSVVVVRGPDTLLSAGYGFADLSHRVPATPATRYRVQSLAGLLGVVLLQQVEAGRITLDDEANRLLPDFPWQDIASRYGNCWTQRPACRTITTSEMQWRRTRPIRRHSRT